MDNRKIGVFDSGLGGLSVVREMRKLMPAEDIVYFGDTARLPYGSKSKESIIGFSRQITRFLLEKDVKAIIIACGTASSNALETLQKEFDLPIIGVVEPGARGAVRETRNGRIGILGTEATVKSGAFNKLIGRIDPKISVVSQACPLFVPLVESGWFHDAITDRVAERYMQSMIEENVDTLVLGCTHYPLIKEAIGEAVGKNVKLINVSKEAVMEVREFLGEHDMLAQQEEGHYEFYTSDSIDHMRSFAELVLGVGGIRVEQIDIEKYDKY